VTGRATTSWAGVVTSLCWDVALPFGVYLVLSGAGWSSVAALVAAGGVALLRAMVVRIRTGVFGALPLLLCGKFALGVLAAAVTGDARFVLAKDAGITACLGLVFLVSLAASRPAIYLVRRGLGGAPEDWAARWDGSAAFRALHRHMTAVWGTVLLTEAVVRAVLAYTLPLDLAALVVPLLGALTILALVAWTQVASTRDPGVPVAPTDGIVERSGEAPVR
jgi:hypothetical protein